MGYESRHWKDSFCRGCLPGCRVYFVDNSTPKAAIRSVQEAERCLKNGASVVVFPEGSRTYTGKMIRFKKGPIKWRSTSICLSCRSR